MSNQKYDTSSVGKLRFGLGILIAASLVLLTLLYFKPSFFQQSLGFLAGGLLFLLRRFFVKNIRFETRRRTRPRFGFATIFVALALTYIIAIDKYAPQLAQETVWLYLAISFAFLMEWLEGFYFYTKHVEPTELPYRPRK
jgi:phosphatidylserine synthase